jgi:hypothetical protein
MLRLSSRARAASAWISGFVAVLVLGGCGADGPTEPSAGSDGPTLATKPIHEVHRGDASFSGVIPCDLVGIDIHATFDDHITVSITAWPEERLRIHTQEVLTLRNVVTGETVIGRFAGNLTLKISPTDVLEFSTGQNTFKDAEGRIIHHAAGRVVFSQATGEVIFESGLHEGFEPDFLTFVCTELS